MGGPGLPERRTAGHASRLLRAVPLRRDRQAEGLQYAGRARHRRAVVRRADDVLGTVSRYPRRQATLRARPCALDSRKPADRLSQRVRVRDSFATSIWNRPGRFAWRPCSHATICRDGRRAGEGGIGRGPAQRRRTCRWNCCRRIAAGRSYAKTVRANRNAGDGRNPDAGGEGLVARDRRTSIGAG